ASLGREVLIWVRPAGAQPLDVARRDCGRTTRLRWLGGGRLGDRPWDAFAAPTGCPLPELVAADGPLAWPGARQALEEVARELRAAAEEHTLPRPLTPGQVWAQATGRLVLLDMPMTAVDAPATEPDQHDCVRLLGDVAALAVLGRPGPLPPRAAGYGRPL